MIFILIDCSSLVCVIPPVPFLSQIWWGVKSCLLRWLRIVPSAHLCLMANRRIIVPASHLSVSCRMSIANLANLAGIFLWRLQNAWFSGFGLAQIGQCVLILNTGTLGFDVLCLSDTLWSDDTTCSICNLLHLKTVGQLELVKGFEPPTYRLQGDCSTNWATLAYRLKVAGTTYPSFYSCDVFVNSLV